MKDLTYFGNRVMDLNKPAPITEYVAKLKDQGHAYIEIHPGDGTAYRFYLIVIGDEGGRVGLTGDGVHVWLAPINLEEVCKGPGVCLRLWPGAATEDNANAYIWDLERLYNDSWTCELLGHYLAMFAEEYHRGDQ